MLQTCFHEISPSIFIRSQVTLSDGSWGFLQFLQASPGYYSSLLTIRNFIYRDLFFTEKFLSNTWNMSCLIGQNCVPQNLESSNRPQPPLLKSLLTRHSWPWSHLIQYHITSAVQSESLNNLRLNKWINAWVIEWMIDWMTE